MQAEPFKELRIAIIGTVGVPGCYGGFETLAQNLVEFHFRQNLESKLLVYCSSTAYPKPRTLQYKSAQLRYMPFKANGVQSILYDSISLLDAIRWKATHILILGVSAGFLLPWISRLAKVRLVVNTDGMEWKRNKWNIWVKQFLKFSEKAAVSGAHILIADNIGIQNYLKRAYSRESVFIPYGGDHALYSGTTIPDHLNLPKEYFLALCRIEPENNVELILEAWQFLEIPLVFVGNWQANTLGQSLWRKYNRYPHIHLLNSIYDPGHLNHIRLHSKAYIHGHSAGGTNPALVEMMHYGSPVIAWDCEYNRNTTEGKALYFNSQPSLREIISRMDDGLNAVVGDSMRQIAVNRYMWSKVASSYFELLSNHRN